MARLKITAKDQGQGFLTEGIACMGKGRAIAAKWMCALVLLWCMITETSTQPATPNLKYPIHTFLLPNASNPTNPCYPDQVHIPASPHMYAPSPYLDKCIKCSQFASNMQTCELLSARLNIIVVQSKSLYRQFAGGTLDCNDKNGYRVQGVHCSHKAIGARYQPGTTDDACFGDEINCYKCESSSTTKCRFCGYGFYPDTNKKCQPISILHCLSLKTSNTNKCDLCEQGYGFLNYLSSGIINKVTCKTCPSSFRDCTDSTDTSRWFILTTSNEYQILDADKKKTITITGAVYAQLTIPQGAKMTIQNTKDAYFNIRTASNVPDINVLNVTCNPSTSITYTTNPKQTYFSSIANSQSTVQSARQNVVLTIGSLYSSSVITLTLQSPHHQTITMQSIGFTTWPFLYRPKVEISSGLSTTATCLMDDTHPLGPCDISFFPCVSHPNCKYCSTRTLRNGLPIQVCQTCQNQLYLLRQKTDCTASCEQVHPYCQQCYVSELDRLPKCRKCQKGFYVDFDGYCQACEWQMPYCEECDISTQCKACQITLYLRASDKTCRWCQQDVGPQCVRCKENGAGVLECQRCRKGFTSNQTHLNKECIPCSNTLAGCKLCSGPNICTTCLPEFYLNATSKNCQNCSQTIPNCARCRPLVTQFQCVQCATNFALQIDTMTGATKCGPCYTITPNCNSCVGKDRCTQCLLTSSTYINTYKNTCNNCKPPCKTCTKKYKCVSCTEPYLMVVDFDKGVCEACWKHVPNCLQCESGANVSATPRNTIDGAQKYSRCLKCKQHSILKQYPVTLGQSCQQCLPTQYAFYAPSDPYGQCLSCSNQCKSCSSPNLCLSCLDAYAQRKANDKIECFDRCGDGKVIDFECDLEVGNEKDGCTSQCTVEAGFVCDLYYKLSGLNLTDKTDKVGIRQYVDSLADRNSQEYIHSQCSYRGAVQMKLKRIQKEKFENLISVELSLEPFLHAYKALSAQQLSTLFIVQYQGETLNRTGYNVRLVPKNRSVLLVFPIEKTLTSPLVVTLAHGVVTSIPRKFVYTLDSTLAFRLKDENGLMPFYYSEDEIKLWGSVHTGLQVVSIVGWVAMAVSVILKSTVGVEFLLILQSLYISLTWYQQPLSLQFISLTGLSLSTGYNPASTLDSQHYSSLIVQQSSIPNRLLEYYVNPNSGQYSSLFIQMQFTAFLFVIFYLLSYIAWMFQISYNPTVVVWARYLNNFFYTDCMMVTAMVQMLPLVNQAFLMGYYWENVEDFDRFIAGNLLVMGVYSLVVVIVRWFRTPHQKYVKIKPKIQPFNLVMQPFSRYNFPLIKQKFFNLYIWTMLFSATSCVFGSFHPMMPCLFYIFLAFLIEWYKPYQNMFSNHRAFYYCLVIAFGYLIRTFYLFRFREDSLAKDCRWTIPVWMLMMVVAFVLGVVDVVMWLRREAAERRLRQEEFLAKLVEQNKLLEKTTVEQQNVKQYRSHNPHVQNLLYHDYYKHQIGPQVSFKMSDSQQVVDKKLAQAKKKLKPKPIQKNQVQYQSNFNVKRKQGLYDQVDIRDQQTLGNEQWVQLNFWKQSKRKEQQLKQKKKHDLSIAYNAIGLVMQFMDDLLKEKGYLNGQLELVRFNLKEKLVNDFREEQYDQGLPYDSQEEQGNKQANQKLLENAETKQEQKPKILTRKEMTEKQLGKYKFVDQVDRHKKEYYREGSFPKVEIHYKKAVKRSESERKPMKKEQSPGKKENPLMKQQNKANFMQVLGKSPIQAFFQGDQNPQPVQYNQRLQIVKMKLKMLRKQNKNIS